MEVLTNDEMHLDILVCSHFPSTIRFDTLRIQFNDTSYDTFREANEAKMLVFEPEVERHFSFMFQAKGSQQLQCTNVTLELGRSPSLVSFCTVAHKLAEQGQKSMRGPAEGSVELSTSPGPVIMIKEPPAKVALEIFHKPPALVDEFYEIKLYLRNSEDAVASGSLLLNFGEVTNNSKDEPRFYRSRSEKSPVGAVTFQEIEPGGVSKHRIFVHFPTVGQKNLVITVSYKTATRSRTMFSHRLSVVIQRPFNFHLEFYTRDMGQIMPPASSAHPFSRDIEHHNKQNHQNQQHQHKHDEKQKGRSRPLSIHFNPGSSPSALAQLVDVSSLPTSGSMLPVPPAISLASSAELTSSILVEDLTADDGSPPLGSYRNVY